MISHGVSICCAQQSILFMNLSKNRIRSRYIENIDSLVYTKSRLKKKKKQ